VVHEEAFRAAYYRFRAADDARRRNVAVCFRAEDVDLNPGVVGRVDVAACIEGKRVGIA